MMQHWYNFDTKQYDALERLPDTVDGVMPYVPLLTDTDIPDVARRLFESYVKMGVDIRQAYLETLSVVIGDK